MASRKRSTESPKPRVSRKRSAEKVEKSEVPAAVQEPREVPETETFVPKDLIDPAITDQGTTVGVRGKNVAVTDPGSTLDS